MKNHFWILILTVLLAAGCGKEKIIEVKLPPYQSQIEVECYLEPGQPYRLTLYESVSYFEEPDLPMIDSALVVITHNNVRDTLEFKLTYDPSNGKLYNYVSPKQVPFDYNSEFQLYVRDKKGREVTSSTYIPQPVPIDTVEFRYNSDTLSFPLVWFTDNPGSKDYYRYLLIQDTLQGDVLADYVFDDVLFQTSKQAVGSNFKLKVNDHIIIRMHHLPEAFYRFLISIQAARDANGNPFGQPATIQSNVNGGLGIFTGLSYSEKQLNVPAP